MAVYRSRKIKGVKKSKVSGTFSPSEAGSFGIGGFAFSNVVFSSAATSNESSQDATSDGDSIGETMQDIGNDAQTGSENETVSDISSQCEAGSYSNGSSAFTTLVFSSAATSNESS